MPPKPFKPPRPSAAPKAKPKPKSTTSTSARKNTTPKSNGVTKSKANSKNGKAGKDKDTPRISAASRLSFAGLPSLSPDSQDERREEDSDEEEAVISDDNNALPAPRRQTSAATARSRPLDALVDESPAPEEETAIPLDLLNVLLHQFYKEDNTRMSKDANRAVGRYMETFVREAVARVAYGKEGGEELEVEDLEKVTPQLLLDF